MLLTASFCHLFSPAILVINSYEVSINANSSQETFLQDVHLSNQTLFPQQAPNNINKDRLCKVKGILRRTAVAVHHSKEATMCKGQQDPCCTLSHHFLY